MDANTGPVIAELLNRPFLKMIGVIASNPNSQTPKVVATGNIFIILSVMFFIAFLIIGFGSRKK